MPRCLVWSVLLLFAVACGGRGTYLRIPEVTTQPTSLDLSTGEFNSWVKVRTEGRDTIVDFRGRVFVFRNLTGYEGRITLENVRLEIGGADVEIDERSLVVEEGARKSHLEHHALPAEKRIVYSAGSLTTE